MKFIAAKMFVIATGENFIASAISFEEGYNELSNEAINLALTCIAQNAKRMKTALTYSFVA